jgi:mannose-6-phosphate isomerase-like protein (cupin superfamily)
MFGFGPPKTPKFDKLQEERRDEHTRERALYWKHRFDHAQDEHETTRIFIEYRNDLLFEWLNDYDRRNAAEMRQHTKTLSNMIVALGFVLIVHHWL